MASVQTVFLYQQSMGREHISKKNKGGAAQDQKYPVFFYKGANKFSGWQMKWSVFSVHDPAARIWDSFEKPNIKEKRAGIHIRRMLPKTLPHSSLVIISFLRSRNPLNRVPQP